MKKEKNKVKKIVLIIILCLLLLGGLFCAIFFALKSDYLKYINVKLNKDSTEITLSSQSRGLAPNDNMLSKAVRVGLDKDSEPSYIRAKIVFENYSDDSRVLSFVSQLNFNVKNTSCFSNDKYSWVYYEQDNAFYLMNNENSVKAVTNADGNYTFIEKLIVPSTIEQMSTLNSDGQNVQIGEDVKIHIAFEAIQTSLPVKKPDIENLSEYFNIVSSNYENGFTSVNGFITECNLNAETLVLPKKVGNDYILGIKANAFKNENLKQIIIPASFIYFEENAFSNLTKLNFLAIKNQINITLKSNTFNSTLSEIYMPLSTLNYVNSTYIGLPYKNSFKQIYELYSNDISQIPTNTSYVYAPNLKVFDAKLETLASLKVAEFPVLETIGEEMFAKLNNLVCVECPNAKVVGKKAFNNCKSLVDVNLNKNVEELGESAFYGCSNLKNINFSKNLKIISKEAFRACTSLTEVSLDADAVEINSSAFYGCSSLRIVKINNLSSCANFAFGECPSLRWFYCRNVTNLTLEEKVFSKTSGEINLNTYCVFNSESVKNQFMAKNQQLANQFVIFSVNDGCLNSFAGNIQNLDLTDFLKFEEITKIGDNVFKNNTTINSLTLPYSIISLGNNVFDGAENLVKIIIDNYQTLLITNSTFNNVSENLQIFVPDLVLDIYKQTYSELNLNFASK